MTVSKTQSLCRCAMMSAVLIAGKQALASIPNIECVTLFLVVFTLVFGLKETLLATICYCLVDTMIWGFNVWVISYFTYWPMLVVLVSLIRKAKLAPLWGWLIAIVCTVFYGVYTTMWEAVFFGGDQFFKYFVVRYISGISFYAAHIASTVGLCGVAVFPLTRILKRFANKTV